MSIPTPTSFPLSSCVRYKLYTYSQVVDVLLVGLFKHACGCCLALLSALQCTSRHLMQYTVNPYAMFPSAYMYMYNVKVVLIA